MNEQPVERLLGRVLGGLPVPEDQLDRPQDGPVLSQEEHLERLVTLSHLFPLQETQPEAGHSVDTISPESGGFVMSA